MAPIQGELRVWHSDNMDIQTRQISKIFSGFVQPLYDYYSIIELLQPFNIVVYIQKCVAMLNKDS